MFYYQRIKGGKTEWPCCNLERVDKKRDNGEHPDIQVRVPIVIPDVHCPDIYLHMQVAITAYRSLYPDVALSIWDLNAATQESDGCNFYLNGNQR